MMPIDSCMSLFSICLTVGWCNYVPCDMQRNIYNNKLFYYNVRKLHAAH